MKDDGKDDIKDRELLRRIARKDEQALGQFYHRHAKALWLYIKQIVHADDFAFDVVNETMQVVWERAGSFRGDAKVFTWIVGIANYKAFAIIRRERKHKTLCMHYGELGACNGIDRDPFEQQDQLRWAAAVLEQLPEEQSVPYILIECLGYSYKEVAEQMGCPLGTLKTRLHSVRKKLKQRLKEELPLEQQGSSSSSPTTEEVHNR